MGIDFKLAELGQDYPRIGLVQQGGVSKLLALEYADALQAVGFQPASTQLMGELVTELETQQSEAAEGRDTSKLNTGKEKAALANAKAFKRKLDLKLRRYFRTPGEKPVTPGAFRSGETLGKSTPKVSAYLGEIREKLELIDAALAPLFGGRSAVAELDAVKAALDGAQTTQEFAKLNLPEETLRVYELKGRLYLLLQELIDAGRDAFDGQAEVAAKFNKDLLLAAVRRRQQEEPLEPTG